MFSQEELDSWNEIFSESKIEMSDLAQPKEAFVTRTLSAYLRVLGFKVPEYNFRSDDHIFPEKRSFLILLARNVDRILKITNGAYSFTYSDLIEPTAKKTQHILGILLNYLYYCDMYKKKVFQNGTERIQKLENLQRSISEAKVENERCIERKKKLESQKANLTESLPIVKERLKLHLANLAQQKNDINHLKKDNVESSKGYKELIAEKVELQRQQVTDDEARDLKLQHAKIIADNQEQIRQEEDAQNGFQESVHTTNTFINFYESIGETEAIVPVHLIETKKNLIKILTDNKKINELKNKRMQCESELSQKKQVLKVAKNNIEKAKNDEKCQNKKKTSLMNMKEQKLKENSISLEKLKEQELSTLLQEQYSIRQLLDETLPTLTDNYY